MQKFLIFFDFFHFSQISAPSPALWAPRPGRGINSSPPSEGWHESVIAKRCRDEVTGWLFRCIHFKNGWCKEFQPSPPQAVPPRPGRGIPPPGFAGLLRWRRTYKKNTGEETSVFLFPINFPHYGKFWKISVSPLLRGLWCGSCQCRYIRRGGFKRSTYRIIQTILTTVIFTFINWNPIEH